MPSTIKFDFHHRHHITAVGKLERIPRQNTNVAVLQTQIESFTFFLTFSPFCLLFCCLGLWNRNQVVCTTVSAPGAREAMAASEMWGKAPAWPSPVGLWGHSSPAWGGSCCRRGGSAHAHAHAHLQVRLAVRELVEGVNVLHGEHQHGAAPHAPLHHLPQTRCRPDGDEVPSN